MLPWQNQSASQSTCNIFIVNRPKYQVLGAFQIRRISLSPSGSGKSVVFAVYHVRYLQNLFPMILVFSLPREVDLAWIPVQTYIEERTKVVDSEEELFGLTILTPKQLFIVWSSSYKFWLYTHNVNKLFIIQNSAWCGRRSCVCWTIKVVTFSIYAWSSSYGLRNQGYYTNTCTHPSIRVTATEIYIKGHGLIYIYIFGSYRWGVIRLWCNTCLEL